MQSREDFFATLTAMNWVEERHQREELIRKKGAELWGAVCLELQESIDTFRRLYDDASYQTAKNGMVVSKGATEETLSIKFDSPRIVGSEALIALNVSAEGGVVWFVNNEASTPALVAKAILQPFLFD